MRRRTDCPVLIGRGTVLPASAGAVSVTGAKDGAGSRRCERGDLQGRLKLSPGHRL